METTCFVVSCCTTSSDTPSAVYGVNNHHPITRFQPSNRPPLPKDDPDPEPMLIPINFSPEDAITCLENLMSLVHPAPNVLQQNESFFRASIRTVSKLFNLQLAHLRSNGHTALAGQHHQRSQQLLT